jgi:LCP family protein required for cell wall assembly
METTRLNKKKIKRRKKKPRWIRIILSVLLVVLIGIGAYLYHVYSDVATAVKKMNVPLAAKKERTVNFNNGEPFSILMLGVDERPNDGGRSDSILVVTVNPKTKTTNLLSIPRDTRTMLINKSKPSKDKMDKINAAYAYGGVQESIDTVENLINVPIDYYIKINMQGFQDLVNAVGGIDVNNKYAFSLDGVTLKTGPQHLNGLQALEYARMRHQDPMGDFGREQRQREVISKIIQKGKSISILTKYNAVLKALENNIQTNLTMNDIIGIQSSYKPAAQHMNSFQLTGTNDTINGIYYYKVDEKERQSVSDKLREALGLSTSPVKKIVDTYQASNQNTSSTAKSSTSSSTTYRSSTGSSYSGTTTYHSSTGSSNSGTTTYHSSSGTTSSTGNTGSSSPSSETSSTPSSGSSGSTGSTSQTGTTGTGGNTGSTDSTGTTSSSSAGSTGTAGSSGTKSTGTTVGSGTNSTTSSTSTN